MWTSFHSACLNVQLFVNVAIMWLLLMLSLEEGRVVKICYLPIPYPVIIGSLMGNFNTCNINSGNRIKWNTEVPQRDGWWCQRIDLRYLPTLPTSGIYHLLYLILLPSHLQSSIFNLQSSIFNLQSPHCIYHLPAHPSPLHPMLH